MLSLRVGTLCRAVMSIGNKRMAYQDNTYNQSRQSGTYLFGIFSQIYRYFLSRYFISRYFEYYLRKIVPIGRHSSAEEKSFEFGFCGCHS